MIINLYSVQDDPRELNKTLTSPIELEAELIYPTELYSPQLRISASNYTPDKNYIYIPTFERYYFITGVTYDNGGAVVISARVDVLMSFMDSIKALQVNVKRQEHEKLSNIIDNQITLTPKKSLSYLLCDKTPFNIRSRGDQYNYVLCVAGGEQGGNNNAE